MFIVKIYDRLKRANRPNVEALACLNSVVQMIGVQVRQQDMVARGLSISNGSMITRLSSPKSSTHE